MPDRSASNWTVAVVPAGTFTRTPRSGIRKKCSFPILLTWKVRIAARPSRSTASTDGSQRFSRATTSNVCRFTSAGVTMTGVRSGNHRAHPAASRIPANPAINIVRRTQRSSSKMDAED